MNKLTMNCCIIANSDGLSVFKCSETTLFTFHAVAVYADHVGRLGFRFKVAEGTE